MRASEFRETVEGQDSFQPFVIRTRSGKRYEVPDPSSFWFPAHYESTVVLAVAGRGITLLDIEAIDSVQFERALAGR